MKPIVLIPAFFLVFSMASVMGCGGSDDGFRFDGEYAADRSGFDVRMVSEGYFPAGNGTGGEAFAIVQVCPSGTAEGRPFRMILTATNDGRTKVESGELGPVAMEWNTKTSEGLFRGLLTSAGFRKIEPLELGGCLDAIAGALGPNAHAAPASARGNGAVGALRVIREDLTEGHEIDHGKAPAEWVAQSEVAGCS